MNKPRLCGHTAASLGQLYRWPPGTVVTYCIQVALPALDDSQGLVEATIANAVEAWSSVCGIAFQRVDDPSQARLWIRSDSIDGPYNVLGQTELPVEGRADVRHTMVLDSGEPWSLIELHECVIHEAGHGIGLEHSPAGTVAIMAPVLNLRVTKPLAWDIAQAQIRYGPPAAAEPPRPMPTPPPPPPAPVPIPPPPSPRWKAVTLPDGRVVADFGEGDWLGTNRQLRLEFQPAPPQITDSFAYTTAPAEVDWQLGIGRIDGHWYKAQLDLGNPIR